MITPGEWKVATGYSGESASANGTVVVRGNVCVADCRNDYLPEAEQRANAKAIAALPHLLDALIAAERYIGSQKGKPAALAYRRVCDAMKWAGITPQPDDDEDSA